MIDLDQACSLAYNRREEFETFQDIGIVRAYDRISYWVITFAYVDKEAQYTPLGTIDMMKPKFFCIEKETGNFISGGVSFHEVEKVKGHPVPVPDKYYRVPWYEYEE